MKTLWKLFISLQGLCCTLVCCFSTVEAGELDDTQVWSDSKWTAIQLAMDGVMVMVMVFPGGGEELIFCLVYVTYDNLMEKALG